MGSHSKYKPNYSDISDDDNNAATVSPLTIKLKPTPAIPNMPMNTSKDAEEAFDRLKKEDEKINNDPKRLQKEISRRLLQRNETAADRIFQKQYKLLQQDQQADNEDRETEFRESSSSPSLKKANDNDTSSEVGLSEPVNEEPALVKDQSRPQPRPSSGCSKLEDAPISLPSDSCDYMELECEIEPFDDESVTPTPPDLSSDSQPKKSTAVVAPTGFKKRKASGGDKRKELNKSKTQRKQQQQQRRVLTIRVKKLKDKDEDDVEKEQTDIALIEDERKGEEGQTAAPKNALNAKEIDNKSKKSKSKEEISDGKES